MVYYRAETAIPFDQKALQQILSLDFDGQLPEIISEDPFHGYQKRIRSATEAFRLVSAVLASQAEVMQIAAVLEKKANTLESYYLGLLKPGQTASNQTVFVRYIQHLEFLLSRVPEKNRLFAEPAQWLTKADEYTLLIQPKPQLLTMSRLEGVASEQYLLQREIPQKPMGKAVLQQYLDTQNSAEARHPRWYQIMKPYEKALFDKVIQEVLEGQDGIGGLAKLKNRIQAISSRLRSIPGLPNFSIHQAFILDAQGKVLAELPGDLRSSVVSSRDHMEFFESGTERLHLRREFTRDNIALIIENFVEGHDVGKEGKAVHDEDIRQLLRETPILLQTLISPQTPAVIKPDSDLFADKNAVIHLLKNQGLVLDCLGRKISISGDCLNLFYTNHPLNPARHIAQTVNKREIGSSTTTPRAMDALIDFTRKHIKSNADGEFIRAVQFALEREKAAPYRRTLDSIADKNHHRELYLAALELLLVSLLGGIAHSTCVSGKDRRAILAIFKDSISVYVCNYRESRHFPGNFFENMLKDPNFIKIFTSIYKSGHHQANAAQNAPGAEGIKTPDLYLPRNISAAIGKQRLNQDNLLAGNNEFNTLLSQPPNYAVRQSVRGAAIGMLSALILTVLLLAAAAFLAYFSLLTMGVFPLMSAIVIGGACTAFCWGVMGGLLGYEIESGASQEQWLRIEKAASEKYNSNAGTRRMFMTFGQSMDNTCTKENREACALPNPFSG